jgi:hypothetical protein
MMRSKPGSSGARFAAARPLAISRSASSAGPLEPQQASRKDVRAMATFQV